ncbi:MAG: hypothetical protein HQM11_01445 [SAR324 cluster bacterium]|nr:hypothetical protein [SAR324 cluster bacterium]
MPYLSEVIKLRRRYTRSINLERDLEVVDSVLGYTPTSKSIEALERFIKSFLTPGMASAWTLTGVYGTGKSAFAHFLASLCAPKDSLIHKNAVQIVTESINSDSKLIHDFLNNFPERGLVRAVVTAQREPMSNAVVRALGYGAGQFWKKKKPDVYVELEQQLSQIETGASIDNTVALHLLQKIAQASQSGVLLIIDELGKCLEYTTQNHDDVYLLQQIAELSTAGDKGKIFTFCLLHQSFNDYAYRLTSTQRNEWTKIQGRFEDIAFADSSEQFIRLIGYAIDHQNARDLAPAIETWANHWSEKLSALDHFENLNHEQIKAIYPLHPLTAIVLPELCKRYAQNDRSLFTFLTSDEPFSFIQFLKTQPIPNSGRPLPALKLHQLYDYFIETSGMSIVSQPQFQKWLEIQGRVHDARLLEPEVIETLKTIGVLNLVGILKTPELTVDALCDEPANTQEQRKWKEIIESLQTKGFVTWHRQINELRIWEGTDFNIEEATREQLETLKQTSVATLLGRYCPLSPLVAQRHSYETGTLRYFERHYADKDSNLEKIKCHAPNSDGIVIYWIGKIEAIKDFPTATVDGKPVLVITTDRYESLENTCYEFVALRQVEAKSPQLQTDGVARKEVRQRLAISNQQLNHALNYAFDASLSQVGCLYQNEMMRLNHHTSLSSQLSIICDREYHAGPHLWNELINRSELTSQGIKASRELINAMLENESQEQLGLTGYGPERSMYESVLRNTGIHRLEEEEWKFATPDEKCGIFHVWKTIEAFCLSATQNPLSLDLLYEKLSRPPYGVKIGLLPVLFTSVLLNHPDDLGIYYDGSFIPLLQPEHFKLMDKQAARFSIKYFGLTGLRKEFFRELESVFRVASVKNKNLRNPTLLGIAKPLIQFVRKLPNYTLNTKRLSPEAIALRQAVLNNTEPKQLLCVDIPNACGLSPLEIFQEDLAQAKTLREKLEQIIPELGNAYTFLIERCQKLIANAFNLNPVEFRVNLQTRAEKLKGRCVDQLMKRFVEAVVDQIEDPQHWLESLLMIIADKPAKSWNDTDEAHFVATIDKILTHFNQLEVLQTSSQIKNSSLKTYKVELFYPNGEAQKQMVWIEKEQEYLINALAEEILITSQFNNHDNSNMNMAVVAKLIEKVFDPLPPLKTENIVKLKG